MKNKYEYLASIFQEILGDNYNVVYNNDEGIEWDKILVNDMINGVMHVNSGGYDNINGYSVTNQQVSLQFMIPTPPEIFSEAVQNIEDNFKGLHNTSYQYENEIIKVLFNYISDANRVLVNGVDYATFYVYLNLYAVKNAVMSNETSIVINGKSVYGLFHVTYTNNHTADSIVKGNVSLVQLNNVNAIQQVLAIDMVAIKNDDLITDLMNNCNTNKIYSIYYYNGIMSRNIRGYLVNLIEDGTFNDTLKVKVVFGVANE